VPAGVAGTSVIRQVFAEADARIGDRLQARGPADLPFDDLAAREAHRRQRHASPNTQTKQTMSTVIAKSNQAAALIGIGSKRAVETAPKTELSKASRCCDGR